MIITVRYFAALRDHRGISSETLDTSAASPLSLFLELSKAHSFPIAANQTRFVVNGSYVESSHPLQEGDEVVFIPPVAGG